LNQAALRELVEGGSAPFKQTARSYVLFCPEPACRRQKLHVEKTTGMGKCFRCGLKGWANWVLARVYSKSPEELDQLLYGVVTVGTIIAANILMTDFWGEEEPEDALLPTAPQYPPAMEKSPNWVSIDEPIARPGLEYLAARGIPNDVAFAYGIGFDPEEQRVLIPVVVEGAMRGWQGRYIHSTSFVRHGKVVNIPKVMTVGKLGKECFMFQDRLKDSNWAILTEGPFDALKCHHIGGNVASMGKDVSPRQLDILVRSGIKTLYVGLDRDADRPVGAIVKALYGVVKLYRLLPPPHRDDLGDCTFQEVAQQVLLAEEMGPMHAHQTHMVMPDLYKG
jgi:hypothetical protein